jgi:hypothetical protein
VQFARQRIGIGVTGYANGFTEIPWGKLDHRAVLTLTDDNTDAGLLMRLAHRVIEHGEVEVHLARVFGPELINFELNGHQALQYAMEEEQVDEVLQPG